MPHRRYRQFAGWLWARPAYVVGILTAVFVLQGALLAAAIHENSSRARENHRLIRTTQQLAHEGQQAHDALCVLRTNLKGRIPRENDQVKVTKDFLLKNPHGIPGIPVALIQKGLARDQATLRDDRAALRALNLVKCKPTG